MPVADTNPTNYVAIYAAVIGMTVRGGVVKIR